jgi:SAM-dependent methyltransferase
MNDLEQLMRREQQFHDQYASDFLAHVGNARNRILVSIRSRIFSQWIKRERPLLELGAGVGTWTRAFSRLAPVCPLDFSLESLKLLKQAIPEARCVHADVRYLPFGPEKFDQIFVGMVLHHLPFEYREEVLRDLFNHLAPGGRLLFFEPNRDIRHSLSVGIRNLKKIPFFRLLLRPLQGDYDHAECSPIDHAIGRESVEAENSEELEPQGFRAGELKQLLEAAGFHVLETRYMHSLQPPTPKWFGLRANRLAVGFLHGLESLFLRRAAWCSHFLFLVAEKKQG